MQSLQNLQNVSAIGGPANVGQSLSGYITSLSGLVAYYPMDETSGSMINQAPATIGSHNGTVSGATQGTTGQVGNSYSFDGVNDSVSISGLGTYFSGDFSVGLLLYFSEDDRNDGFFNHHRTDTDFSSLHLVRQTDERIDYNLWGSGNDWSNIFIASSATWQYLFFTYNNTTKGQQVFKNGVSQGTRTQTNGTNFATGTTYIGRNIPGLTYMKGRIQHVSIFNSVVSSADILKMTQLAGL